MQQQLQYKEKDKYESNLYMLYRIYKDYVRSRVKIVVLTIICMIVVAACTSLNAWLLKPVLDGVFFEKNTAILYYVPAIIIAVALVKGVATFFQMMNMKILGQNILNDIRMRLYSHLIHSDMKFITEYPSGNLISRFTNDINSIRIGVVNLLSGLIVEIFTIIGLVTVMLMQSVKLSLIFFFFFPISFFVIKKIAKRLKTIAKSQQEEMSNFTVHLDETFNNIKIIKSYCREDYEILRAERTIEKLLSLYKRAAKLESISSPLMELLGYIGMAFVIFYAGYSVINGTTTPGSFVSFIASALLLYKPVKSLSNLNTSLQEGFSAARRLFTMIDEQAEIVDNIKQPSTHFKTYNIKFQNVFFSYKSNKKNLDGVNLSIPQGKTVALVGGSGAGKSTIFNLLQRFYDPDFGEITVDGKNIQSIRLKSLRDSISFVSQEVSLFDDTIRENIRYGKLGATEEEIMDAALAAAAHDFITDLPDGYNTMIGQHGHKLSGGQRQRIAIARAILKDAPILLLDEATSSLDSVSEKQVQMAFDYLKKGRTTIIIAHRLSTIEKADLIYVISDGKVKESGTHEELLEKDGEYANLYKKYKDDKID